ncbi:MAG: hypothetical protein KC635_28315, partial [Myxococcales bacterium]|nr:hypothetical protein [Myxococcales bacterium]
MIRARLSPGLVSLTFTLGAFAVVGCDSAPSAPPPTTVAPTERLATPERCGTPMPSAEVMAAVEQHLLAVVPARRLKARSAATVTIPVWVHVVTASNGTGALTAQQIADQIDT